MHGQGDYYLGMVVVRIETSMSKSSKAIGGLVEKKRNSRKFLERVTELQKKGGLEWGKTEEMSREENNIGMISISCLFFHFHTIPLCFLCILVFYFDAWIWALETFADSYWIWVCLHAFYAWFLTYFLGSILGFHMRWLQLCLGFHLKSIWSHSHTSQPVDNSWNEALLNKPSGPPILAMFLTTFFYILLCSCVSSCGMFLVRVSPSESTSLGSESCDYEVLASKESLRNILSSWCLV